MKIYTLILAILLLVLFVPIVKAQTATPEPQFDYDRAYQDYVFTLDQYQKQHSEYVLARSQYLQAQTLVAQSKAQTETEQMLEARDDVVTTYLTALRLKLTESNGISDTIKNGLFERLDTEIAWFKDHKERLSSAGTLNDLVDYSDEANDRYLAARPLVYEVLSTIPVGKVSVLREELNVLLNKLRDKTNEIRGNGDLDTQIVERWIIETDDKVTLSLDKEISAEQLTAQFSTKDVKRTNFDKSYDSVIELVQDSNQLLRDASKYMKEIINGLTTI